MDGESNKAVWAALVANVAIAITKFLAAAASGSAAMLAEAVHSSVDSFNEVFLLWGAHRSKRPADADHPFGHGHELYFWTMIVAINVFAVGGGISIYEGIIHILNPSPLEGTLWSYVVLAVAFVFEGSSLLIGWRSLRGSSGGRRLWRQVRETKNPKVLAVVFEDSAAIAGVVVAFLGVLLSHALNLPVLDGVASLVIGLILATVALLLGRETKGLLLGESALPEKVRALEQLALEEPTVSQVTRALTLHLGPQEILLNMDVRFQPNLSAEEVQEAIGRLERKIRQRFPEVKDLFIEAQSLHDPPGPPPGRPRQSASELLGEPPEKPRSR